jgi:hypothetical protein
VTWDADIIDGIHFIEHSVLQVPFFLMTLMRYITPTLDNMFMNSLEWVDQTYYEKHEGENPNDLRATYHPNLKQYSTKGTNSDKNKDPYAALQSFLMRFGKKAAISLGVYLLSLLPYVGRFILPAASFYTFNKSVGWQPAVVIFGSGIFLPKKYLVMFLQSYFSSRTLMRELVRITPATERTHPSTNNPSSQLDPYFARIRYTPEQKKLWFHDRSGVLYGFAVAFFFFLKVPLLGVLIYGIAEASTAYLITKITDPPPPPQEAEEFKKKDVRWDNKHEFLSLPLDAVDKINARVRDSKAGPTETGGEVRRRQFT